MIPRIDLHIHSTYSDGIKTPAEILNEVREKNLAAFAITDHDNAGAYFEARELLKEGDPELITGVELSAGKGGEDLHILGYFFDPNSAFLASELERFREIRNQRGALMLQELRKLGIDIPLDMVIDIAGKSAIGRPHVANAMVQVGAVNNMDEAFIKYIGLEKPAYIPKANLTPKDAIELIHSAGGLAFLAHPRIAGASKYIREFVGYGLDGIEIYHPYHFSTHIKAYSKLTEKLSILGSGGSDYHGREGKYGAIGSQPVPYDLLSAMKTKVKIKD